MKTVMIKDSTLAISLPSNWSLTMAIVTIRGELAPSACKKRPSKKVLNALANRHTKVPTIKIPIPKKIALRLPQLSDKGPNTSCPRPRPTKKIEITNGASSCLTEANSCGRMARAGNTISMLIAGNAVSMAMSRTNSIREVLFEVGLKNVTKIAVLWLHCLAEVFR